MTSNDNLYRWKRINSKDDLPKEAGRYHVKNEKTFGEAYAFFESGAFGGHLLDNITHYLVPVEADQQEESQMAIIANNLYNIHGSNGHGIFDTDKCDEIASFILQDLKKEYTLIPKQ